MAEVKRKIKLGLEEYVLEFDTASLMLFEEKTGRGLSEFYKAPRILDILTLLWVAVRRKDPGLTLEHVRDFVPPRRIAEVSEIVLETLARELGAVEEVEEDRKVAADPMPASARIA